MFRVETHRQDKVFREETKKKQDTLSCVSCQSKLHSKQHHDSVLLDCKAHSLFPNARNTFQIYGDSSGS
jgi:hypothetical protein